MLCLTRAGARVCTHSRTHTHSHARTHSHTRMHARTHAHSHTHTHTRTHARTHTHTHARTHTYTRTHTHVGALTHSSACTRTRTKFTSFVFLARRGVAQNQPTNKPATATSICMRSAKPSAMSGARSEWLDHPLSVRPLKNNNMESPRPQRKKGQKKLKAPVFVQKIVVPSLWLRRDTAYREGRCPVNTRSTTKGRWGGWGRAEKREGA